MGRSEGGGTRPGPGAPQDPAIGRAIGGSPALRAIGGIQRADPRPGATRPCSSASGRTGPAAPSSALRVRPPRPRETYPRPRPPTRPHHRKTPKLGADVLGHAPCSLRRTRSWIRTRPLLEARRIGYASAASDTPPARGSANRILRSSPRPWRLRHAPRIAVQRVEVASDQGPASHLEFGTRPQLAARRIRHARRPRPRPAAWRHGHTPTPRLSESDTPQTKAPPRTLSLGHAPDSRPGTRTRPQIAAERIGDALSPRSRPPLQATPPGGRAPTRGLPADSDPGGGCAPPAPREAPRRCLDPEAPGARPVLQQECNARIGLGP